jgi:predicted Zn finger-like uncharacterized protein
MLTRCPICHTTFRITPDQLKARQGQVRCGQCLAEFSALETLVDDLTQAAPAATPWPELPPSLPTTEPQGIWESVRDSAQEPHLEPVPQPKPEPEAPIAPEPSIASPAVSRRLPRPALSDPEPDSPPEEPFLQQNEAPRRWPWALGSLVALLLLAVQMALHFRVELAAKAPRTRPALVAACETLGCQLALPTEIAQIGIESSDLHPDGQNSGHLQLVATLRNRAPYGQTWPHLELTLTDSGDRALVRRAIAPAEYLPAKLKAEEGFRAKSEQPLQLDLQAPGVPAVGYRLYVFYP